MTTPNSHKIDDVTWDFLGRNCLFQKTRRTNCPPEDETLAGISAEALCISAPESLFEHGLAASGGLVWCQKGRLEPV